MQSTVGSVRQVIVYKNVQKHPIHCQLTEVQLLPVVDQG